MKIGMHTLGTRGDVQPYLALSAALKSAGHQALLVAPEQFRLAAQSRGIGFAALPSAFLELLHDKDFAPLLAGGKVRLADMRAILARYRPIMQSVLDCEAEAARAFQPDVIVHHPKALGAPSIAAHSGATSVLASPLPGFTPTRSFPSPLVPFRALGWLNRFSHAATANAAQLLFRGTLRAWRQRTFGDASGPRAPAATLYAYSPAVLPVPPDWPPNVLVTGYWFLDEPSWSPPASLLDFLAAGPPPVYVGFGSMPLGDPKRLEGIVLEALRHTQQRAVVAAGWGGFGRTQMPPDVYVLDQAPHEWLFPRMAAVVHHGGAGTTAAALRAGRPSVICPFFGDQPFWGRRMEALAVGSAPLPIRSVTAHTLVAALQQVARPDIMRNAESLGERIRAEHGLKAAVEFLERLPGSFARTTCQETPEA